MARPLNELIREYPELGEALAEFENRVGYLEACQPTSRSQEATPVYQDMQWTRRQWDYVQQLHGQILHLQKELQEHIAHAKRKGDKL